jgi:hypothetical protein
MIMLINNSHASFAGSFSFSMSKQRLALSRDSINAFNSHNTTKFINTQTAQPQSALTRDLHSVPPLVSLEVKRIQLSFSGLISWSTGERSEEAERDAAAQINTGKMMNVNANPGTSKDSVYRFEIEIDGKAHELSFNADHKETNKSFQQKMADAINEAGIGVTASVTVDEDGKNSALSIESTVAGTAFTIKDVEGNAVELTGINTVTQEAQNPQQAIVNELRSFTGSFNKIIWHAAPGSPLSKTLVSSMQVTVEMSKFALSSIGINCTEKGGLEVDGEKAQEAVENGAFARFFNDRNSMGVKFMERLLQLFDNFTKNPWQFMSAAFEKFNTLDVLS